MVKAANSPWRCNDRGNVWLKIKPDYLQVSPPHVLHPHIVPFQGTLDALRCLLWECREKVLLKIPTES